MSKSDELAIKVIIDIINEKYGYDFKDYSKASFKRRLKHHLANKEIKTLPELILPLLTQDNYFAELLSDLSITVTDMFRDPAFYKAFSEKLVPKLKTYPFLKIWHAGCSTGEEVYSMSILLDEHNYLDRTQLYATDFNPHALNIAKKGIYKGNKYTAYAENYFKSGFRKELSNYLIQKYDAIKIKNYLRKKVAFSLHNLAADNSFGEMEVILCRNVMIYFEEKLRRRVLSLFNESLIDYGYLCLGSKETINHPGFKCIDAASSIYQKIPK